MFFAVAGRVLVDFESVFLAKAKSLSKKFSGTFGRFSQVFGPNFQSTLCRAAANGSHDQFESICVQFRRRWMFFSQIFSREKILFAEKKNFFPKFSEVDCDQNFPKFPEHFPETEEVKMKMKMKIDLSSLRDFNEKRR